MRLPTITAGAGVAVLGAVLAGCTSAGAGARAPARPVPVAQSVANGDCGDLEQHGVVSNAPSFIRADRDLDGDDVDETLVADRSLCTDKGNCHWNLFQLQDGCQKYLGTVSAARLQRVSPRGEAGFFSLRTWWNLSGDERMLLQEYRFLRGSYRLVEVLLCKQSGDDRVLCAQTDESKVEDSLPAQWKQIGGVN